MYMYTCVYIHKYVYTYIYIYILSNSVYIYISQRVSTMLSSTWLQTAFASDRQFARIRERWGAGVETQKNVRGEIGGWGRVPFNETYAPSLSTIYDGA